MCTMHIQSTTLCTHMLLLCWSSRTCKEEIHQGATKHFLFCLKINQNAFLRTNRNAAPPRPLLRDPATFLWYYLLQPKGCLVNDVCFPQARHRHRLQNVPFLEWQLGLEIHGHDLVGGTGQDRSFRIDLNGDAGLLSHSNLPCHYHI